jgi:hypothetical protein
MQTTPNSFKLSATIYARFDWHQKVTKGERIRVGIQQNLAGEWFAVALNDRGERVNGTLASWKTEQTARKHCKELAGCM